MHRAWEYLEARMPEKGSRTKTVNCKFAVGTARMLIENESRHTFSVNDINLWLVWLRSQREGKIRDRLITANDPQYGIEAWLDDSEPNAPLERSTASGDTLGGVVGNSESEVAHGKG